jgi:hypothetical protein
MKRGEGGSERQIREFTRISANQSVYKPGMPHHPSADPRYYSERL